MDRKPSVAAFALIVLCACLLVGCSESQAEAAADDQHPMPRAAAPAAPAATEMLPPPATVAGNADTDALERAADVFAHALATHDLTGMTMSFTPGGLAQAQALTAETGTQRGEGITAASVATFRDLNAPEQRWEVYLDVTGKRGDVQLRTVWQWFDASGWRIVAIELLG